MKRGWSWWNNYLAGIPWERWRVLRAENAVDPGYAHRAAFVTLMSFRNSLLRRQEERRFGDVVAKTRIDPEPLFVLGHWRSGTTHLQNLLACDRDRWATPNSLQVTFPYTFLTTEEESRRRFAGAFPATRPMDNVAIALDSPQEDEFALCTSALRSPFLGMASFPRRAEHYDRYLTFRGVPDAEREDWESTWLWFLRKVTLKHGRPLLLKSPPHTARIGMILRLFPRARFVHIRRHPHAVFQSNRHLLQTLAPIHSLQPLPEDTAGPVLRRFRLMYEAYFEERELIPEGQLHEVAYEDLVADPVAQVRAMYERLGLDGFERMRPDLEAYLGTVKGYERNRFPELPADLRDRIAREWHPAFDAWGYAP